MSISIRKLDSSTTGFDRQLSSVLAFEASEDEAIDRAAAAILADVKTRGDAAVLEYTKRFDRLDVAAVTALEIGRDALQAALAQLSPVRRQALQTAADRVRAYHERQKQECGSDGFLYTEADGTVLGQKVTPLDRVGIYVPGGKAAYPSSVLMNAIPAKVAGVQEVIMVVPTPDGVQNELVLAAAAIAGVDRVFTIGGAQAVGALAYGTASIPQVDKIVGPGNYSLVIIAVSGLFVGFVLGLQGYYTLNKYGSEQALGLLVALSLTRELGPVVTALLFAGRAGTSLTAEIGLMKAGEQLAAMEMMAVDPLQRVIAPRFWAGVVAMPVLAAIFSAVGVFGGYIVGVKLIGVDEGAFWSQMQGGVDVWNDIANGVLKSVVFGIAVTFVALFQGYEAKPTPEGVARATTRTVVIASLLVLALDFLLTALMFS